MLPLWIINLGEDGPSVRQLEILLDSLAAPLRPYWHYTRLRCAPVRDPEGYRAAEHLLVEEGQGCYNAFMGAGLRVPTFQIAVLSFADEPLSQSLFAPMAGILRDALPKIVADHANLGVEITGLVYVPSTVNQEPDEERRRRTALFLEEVNLLSGTDGVNGYSRVVAFQDIQYQHCRFYERLDADGRAELLFQYLSHLYLGSAAGEKLFDRIGPEGGVYALGAASVYFNPREHRESELNAVTEVLLGEFKDPESRDEELAAAAAERLLENDAFASEEIAGRLTEGCALIHVDLRKLEGKPDPHPVRDLFDVDLFPSYYGKYLRYTPARLIKYMQGLSYALLSRYAASIREGAERLVENGRLLLRSAADGLLTGKGGGCPTIAQLETFYTKAKAGLERLRSLSGVSSGPIIPVPAYLKADYERCLKGGEGGESPSDILAELKKNLRKEPVILSLLVRCLLLGIILVVLAVISVGTFLPHWMGNAWVWGPVLFLLPFLVELLVRVRRHFKRVKRLKYRMLAATLLSVNRRLDAELGNAVDGVYDALLAACEEQLRLLASFRGLLRVPEASAPERLLPRTRFNQPLFEGAFKGERMVPEKTAVESGIELPTGEKRLSELERKDRLALLQFIFANPSAVEAMHLDGPDSLPSNAEALVRSFKESLAGRLRSLDDTHIASVLSRLEGKADMGPLRRMAGLNGMLFDTASGNRAILKASTETLAFEGEECILDPALIDYLMLTTWQRLPLGLPAARVCNCATTLPPEPAFGDLLALYYAFHRERKGGYMIGNVPVPVKKQQMEQIDRLIRGEDQGHA